jgi:hypothetical protein
MAIEVVHLPNRLSTTAYAGRTVGDVRDELAEALTIPDDSGVKVNNVEASDSHVLVDGDRVEFSKKAGEKGAKQKAKKGKKKPVQSSQTQS